MSCLVRPGRRAPLGAALQGRFRLHGLLNAYWEPLTFELPRLTPGVHGSWRRWIDTYRDAPDDICDEPLAPLVEAPSYTVQARSIVVLFALRGDAMLGSPHRSVERPRNTTMTAPGGGAT
jgi:pullulanase/glycogen debranching enzyme